MLATADNELITQTGPGTPIRMTWFSWSKAKELLNRRWLEGELWSPGMTVNTGRTVPRQPVRRPHRRVR